MPGRNDSAPGLAGTTPGQSATAPGLAETNPGHGGSPPGQSGTAPGLAGATPGQSGTTPHGSSPASGNSGAAPGQAVPEVAQSSGNVTQIVRDTVGRPTGNSATSPLVARDNRNWPIVRSEVLAVSPSSGSLEIARRLRFTVERQDRLGALGISVATLQAPDGMNATEALAALRRADPAGTYDYDHLYNPSGSAVSIPPAIVAKAASAASNTTRPLPHLSKIRVGMIDGGVDAHHPVFQQARLRTQDFASVGKAPATIHGTAVASLLVGHDHNFSGYLPDASLYAADVFGGLADGGSAEDIARALNWMAANKIAVTNVSLAGPANALLGAAVKAFVASGHLLVAAAGNNGPAAGPSYPAAYPGVVAVTSVDSQKRYEIDASRKPAQFAALGVDVRAANPAGGYANMTGTSFAAPAVSARFAMVLDAPNVANRKLALTALSKVAAPLAPNKDGPRFLGVPSWISDTASPANNLVFPGSPKN